MFPQCSHITRKRGVYYGRRQPGPTTGEVALSQLTKNYRRAEFLAGILDRAFNRTAPTMLLKPDIQTILRQHLKDQLLECPGCFAFQSFYNEALQSHIGGMNGSRPSDGFLIHQIGEALQAGVPRNRFAASIVRRQE